MRNAIGKEEAPLSIRVVDLTRKAREALDDLTCKQAARDKRHAISSTQQASRSKRHRQHAARDKRHGTSGTQQAARDKRHTTSAIGLSILRSSRGVRTIGPEYTWAGGGHSRRHYAARQSRWRSLQGREQGGLPAHRLQFRLQPRRRPVGLQLPRSLISCLACPPST